MSGPKVCLLDTNVLSDLQDHAAYTSLEFQRIGFQGAGVTCLITYLEFLNGALKHELFGAKKFIEAMPFVPITERAEAIAREMARSSLLKHQRHTADCIIAAIAVERNYPIITANGKDFYGLHPDLQIIPFRQYSTYRAQGGKPV